MNELNFAANLSDMKEIDYRNTLAIVSLIELLMEKKILSKEDISKKVKELEDLAIMKANETISPKV